MLSPLSAQREKKLENDIRYELIHGLPYYITAALNNLVVHSAPPLTDGINMYFMDLILIHPMAIETTKKP